MLCLMVVQVFIQITSTEAEVFMYLTDTSSHIWQPGFEVFQEDTVNPTFLFKNSWN